MKAKELVYLNDIGNAITTSLLVAEALGENHLDVFNEVTRLLEEEKMSIKQREKQLRTANYGCFIGKEPLWTVKEKYIISMK